MLTNSVQSRAGASNYPSRTSSVPCVMPLRRRNHDLTLLGLEAVGQLETRPAGETVMSTRGFLGPTAVPGEPRGFIGVLRRLPEIPWLGSGDRPASPPGHTTPPFCLLPLLSHLRLDRAGYAGYLPEVLRFLGCTLATISQLYRLPLPGDD